MGDSLWSNVSLHLPFDGTDGDTTTTDESDLNNTASFYGTAKISNAQSKWGGTSLLTQGSSGVTFVNSSALLDVNGDFSIRAWVWVPSLSDFAERRIVNTLHSGDNSGINFAVQGWPDNGTTKGILNYRLSDASGTTIASAFSAVTDPTLSPLTWHFVELVRDGNDHYLFLDGVKIAEDLGSTGTAASTATDLYVGNLYLNNGALGHIDDLQITNGANRVITNYTPPTGPLEIGPELQSDARVQIPSILGTPAALLVEESLFASFPSILGLPKARLLNDFSALVTDPSIRYVMRITGSPVIELPISSWQATVQTGSAQFLQTVIPAATPYLTELAARRGASEFIVYRVGRAGNHEVESEMARAPLTTIDVSSGPTRETAVISGRSPAFNDAVPSGTKPLSGIRSSFQSLGGNARVRAEIDWFLRPGQQVSANGITFTANYINYFVPTRGDAYMDVGSRG